MFDNAWSLLFVEYFHNGQNLATLFLKSFKTFWFICYYKINTRGFCEFLKQALSLI